MRRIDYFDIEKLIEEYPDAWCYICIGGRKIGKTYSALRMMRKRKKKFVFVKRQLDDVKFLCAGNGTFGRKPRYDENGLRISADLSPFVPINRDFGTNVQAWSIMPGLGGFWDATPDGEPVGEMIGYIAALAGVTKYKGFDMSAADYMIFDEFVPQPWERVNRKEGEQILDLHATISRDREQRGRGPLKLLALANATEVNSPLTNVLEVTDDLAFMAMHNIRHNYIEDRGIVLQLLETPESFMESEQESVVYRALSKTAWGEMAYGNTFAYNDMSNVRRQRLKGFRPWLQLRYKRHDWYIWRSDLGGIYVCTSAFKASEYMTFDLSKENDQKRFYRDYYFDIRAATMENRVTFETYSMYDVIVNFKHFYKV